VVAGYDFTFGTHRSGTVETLEILCTKHGLSCHILEAQMLGETLISSSQIRAFVSHGDMERAKALLGRYFFVAGQVIRGAGRGASIGIPTANLKVENELIPMAGVYACWVEYGKNRYKAVTNIGMNPTFGGNTLSVETHLLRFKGEIYGKKLRLHFVKKIREERTFASSEELVKQIKKDIDTAKRIF
jgi:riboflavin kinase/FMN adenylyltransferase